MPEKRICPNCGTEMPRDSLEGHCPKCLGRILLDEPAQQKETKCPQSDELLGQTIGRYKLLEQLGKGGFGVVYLAEQLEPVQRKVALKIIKAGMDSSEIIARFEAERQALALMDHPNIAKVLDAGTTETRRPYFVMELVHGLPITAYCDQKQLSTIERLGLFIKVCQAVQHAHQKAIIHRDLKPSNVLVTIQDSQPMPKVIDFGIAKALDQRLTDKTIFTCFGLLLGTPAYMSPEQADMGASDIDTRSDIYSLGVLFYELLTGHLPFDEKELAKAGLDEMRRIIRDKEPLPPSTRLTQLLVAADVNQRKFSSADKLSSEPKISADSRRRLHETIALLRGDLDWIVMKCLEKDRSRRYDTVNGLARDIERFMANEPVSARAPSQAYRLKKFVRRNKLAVSAAGAVAVALVFGLGLSTWLFLREKDARQRATRSEADAMEKLRASYLAQAQAGRFSHRAGRRFSGLELLKKASAIRPSVDLRNEAIACLALPDLRLAKDWEGRKVPDGHASFDFIHGRYARDDQNGNLSIRSLTDDSEKMRFSGPGVAASGGLRFSPAGRFVLAAYGAPANRCVVWDLPRAEPALILTNFFTRYWDFSSDDRLIAVAELKHPTPAQAYNGRPEQGPFSGVIHLYDLSSRRETNSIITPSLPFDVRFDPSHRKLAVSFTRSPIVKIFDVSSARLENELSFPGPINFLDWHPNGKLLAAAGTDWRIYLWDLVAKTNRSVFVGHQYEVQNVRFSKSGNWLASGSWDSTFRMWDTFSSQQILSTRLVGGFLTSSDEHWWGNCPGAGTKLELWEMSSERELRQLHTETSPADEPTQSKFSPAGSLFATCCKNGVFYWDLVSGREVGFTPLASAHGAVFTPDGRSLLTCSDAGLQEWLLASNPVNGVVSFDTPRMLSLPHEVLEASVSQDGAVAYVQDGIVRLSDLSSHEKRELKGAHSYTRVVMSPNGKLIAAWGVPAQAFDICETTYRKTIKSIKGAGNGFALFNPTATALALGDYNSYQLLDLSTWKPLFPPRTQPGLVARGFAFSQDGAILAVSHSETIVQLLNAATGRELASLEAPDPQAVNWLAFSPDGTQLAVTCNLPLTQLWDLRLIRSELAAMNLDWDLPPYPAAEGEKGATPGGH